MDLPGLSNRLAKVIEKLTPPSSERYGYVDFNLKISHESDLREFWNWMKSTTACFPDFSLSFGSTPWVQKDYPRQISTTLYVTLNVQHKETTRQSYGQEAFDKFNIREKRRAVEFTDQLLLVKKGLPPHSPEQVTLFHIIYTALAERIISNSPPVAVQGEFHPHIGIKLDEIGIDWKVLWNAFPDNEFEKMYEPYSLHTGFSVCRILDNFLLFNKK